MARQVEIPERLEGALRPLREQRETLSAEAAELRTRLDDVRNAVKKIDAMLKLVDGDRPPKPKPKRGGPAAEVSERVRQLVTQAIADDETPSAFTARELFELYGARAGVGFSSISKALAQLQREGKLRLVGTRPASADGRGSARVYGRWTS